MSKLQPDGKGNHTGTTSNGRYVVTVTTDSIDHALLEVRQRFPNFPVEEIYDADYWVRHYDISPQCVWETIYDRGIECTFARCQ